MRIASSNATKIEPWGKDMQKSLTSNLGTRLTVRKQHFLDVGRVNIEQKRKHDII